MKKIIIYFVASLGIVGCRSTSSHKHMAHDMHKGLIEGKVFAHASLEGKSDSHAHGKAWFAKNKKEVQVVVSVSDASPGLHGIHIHEKGDCSASDASSAGEHFNPTHLSHGAPNPLHHHIGDLGNIVIGQDGHGTLNLIIPASEYNPHFQDWTKIIGKSLVLHQNQDDLKSQPAGD